MMKLTAFCVLLALWGVNSQSTTTPKPTKAPLPDLETELTNRGHYTVLLDLLKKAGIMDTLKAADKITLFAPTDDAFAKMTDIDQAALAADPQKLLDVLGYHVTTDDAFKIRGHHFQDRVYNSYNNKPIRINDYTRLVHVVSAEGVNITERNIQVANGFIQGLGGVMTPPAGDVVDILSQRSDMTTLTTLLSKAGLVDAIRADFNMTVFAPTDRAFSAVTSEIMSYLGTHDKQLTDTLLFHVVKKLTLYSVGMRHTMTFNTADSHHDRLMLLEDDNGDASINHAKILEKDISATNGVIHIIDDVLVPIRVIIAMEESGIMVG